MNTLIIITIRRRGRRFNKARDHSDGKEKGKGKDKRVMDKGKACPPGEGGEYSSNDANNPEMILQDLSLLVILSHGVTNRQTDGRTDGV